MSTILFIALHAAESREYSTHDYIRFQRHCMLAVFDLQQTRQSINRMDKTRILRWRDDPFAVCAWRGVTCMYSIVRAIEWDTELSGDHAVRLTWMDVRWLPPTVHRVLIANQFGCKPSPASTRHFPREVTNLRMSCCALFGSIDMTVLPLSLEILDLAGNQFHGELVLANLPRSLVIMNLRRNDFHSVLVDNESLPSNFRQCALCRYQKNRVHVRTVTGAPVDGRVIVERINIFGRVYID
ncbi:hypothetical protein XU18_5252 [Perkinsela sp. CCAP 1560/4]|nr:hypothetical protein XU18_5252 [Perkinsela sp. CCAP 1560/4]|eukprot:KNH00531.1 hypothetical protein XU18_5252 [Perkinsela sp. CCAP 1560/4]